MNHLWNELVDRLNPYVPGEQPDAPNTVKLNTNENPYGPSPKVLEAIRAECTAMLRLYPSADAAPVKRAVAKVYGITPDQVFVGNGSDEVLAHIFLGLLKHESPVLFPDVTYSFYEVYCTLYDIAFTTLPLDASFGLHVADYLQPNGGIIFANPNAPTGCLVTYDEIRWLLDRNQQSVVVIDEAYVDFGGQSVVPLVNQYANLVVVQTLSKSRSLAGLRVGFAMGHPDLMRALDRVKNCFNSYPVDRLAIAGAVAALEDRNHFETTRRAVMLSREALAKHLEDLGFEVLPSAANFVFARHPRHDARQLALALQERSIFVRHIPYPRIEQYLRITVGTDSDCSVLLLALRKLTCS